MTTLHSRLVELVAPIAESLGCEFWGLEYRTQGRGSLLRIYIDKPDGVAVEDCERVSRQVASALDVEDPIRSEYQLEVSSPGLDRPLLTLDQYRRNIGALISLRLRLAFEGRRKFSGRLTDIEDDEIVLQQDQDEFLLPFELIEKANIVPEF